MRADRYLDEAVFIRDLAERAKSAETRVELLHLATAYERLARRVRLQMFTRKQPDT